MSQPDRLSFGVISVVLCLLLSPLANLSANETAALLLQSDFGSDAGDPVIMRGIAYSVDRHIPIFDITHEIPAFNVHTAAYRLKETAPHWPAGTVFVSIVDPGASAKRKPVVLKTQNGQFFVSPDNGTLSMVADTLGIAAVREINETDFRNRFRTFRHSFPARDIYTYTGARLASGQVAFDEIGPLLDPVVVALDTPQADIVDGVITGDIPFLDTNYGNVQTTTDSIALNRLGIDYGDIISVKIRNGHTVVYEGEMPFVRTYDDVPLGEPLISVNRDRLVIIALNQENFATKYKVSAGKGWTVAFSKK